MKKIVLYISIIIVYCLVFVNVNKVYALPDFWGAAQTALPGIDCGIPGGKDGKDKCCFVTKQTFPKIDESFNVELNGLNSKTSGDFIGSLLSKLPGIGGIIDMYNDKVSKIEDIQKKLPNNPCLYGQAMINKVPTTNYSDPNCKCQSSSIGSASTAIADMCYKYLSKSKSKNEFQKCLECSAVNKLPTGMGCVPLDINEFITNFVLKMGIGFAGGIALLCIIYSAFSIQTSMGNPEKLKKAQENLTACISGLILIIFSVFILKFIGVDILKIPFK